MLESMRRLNKRQKRIRIFSRTLEEIIKPWIKPVSIDQILIIILLFLMIKTFSIRIRGECCMLLSYHSTVNLPYPHMYLIINVSINSHKCFLINISINFPQRFLINSILCRDIIITINSFKETQERLRWISSVKPLSLSSWWINQCYLHQERPCYWEHLSLLWTCTFTTTTIMRVNTIRIRILNLIISSDLHKQ